MSKGEAGGAERVGWNMRLEFWDVVAAMVGFALAGALRTLVFAGYSVLWLGAPVAFVVARRALLPRLSPARTEPRPPISIGRRIGAYALMVPGGMIALIAGVAFYVMATDADHPTFGWQALVVAAVGMLIAALGVRRIT